MNKSISINESEIMKYLNEKDVDPSYYGYEYLITAIKMATENPEEIHKFVDFMGRLAEHFDTTLNRLWRNMRTAVEKSLDPTSPRRFVADAVNYFQIKDAEKKSLYPFLQESQKAEIQAAANVQSESLNAFIVKAIDERLERLGRAGPLFAPPSGDWCLESCKKRGELISGDDGLWCFAYSAEIADFDKKSGQYHKCAACMYDTK